MNKRTLYIGIDVGTGGVRCLAVDLAGVIHAEGRQGFSCENTAREAGRSEQNPSDWLRAVDGAMGQVGQALAGAEIGGIAVDGTSGTILAVDGAGLAASPGIMHNDVRAVAESASCSALLGQKMSPTFGLPKAVWLQKHGGLPSEARFLHQADFVNEWLCGTRVSTDFTNAMKSGVDLETLSWPEGIEASGVPATSWPSVCRPSDRIGTLSSERADAWGLSLGIPVFAGATDSNAAFYASGAAEEGEWNTTIGTTLAVKGVSPQAISDPDGRIYNHRHPDLSWLPGGASNGGGEMLREWFDGEDFAALDELAATRGQTDHLVYPSVRRGERLPIADADFEPFADGERDDRIGLYLGALEGTAFLERRTYDLLEELDAIVGPVVYATGGGAKSSVWLQLRANVLNREIRVPECAESAMGSAILAAAGANGSTVGATAKKMVRIGASYTPDADGLQRSYYDQKYKRFCERLHA